MKAFTIGLTALIWLVAGGFQARAQSADDWDLADGTIPGVTMASVAFSGGSAIAVRCRAGTLDVLVAGLPASTSASRKVETTMPEIAAESGTWLAQSGAGVISAPEPSRIARMLRSGGHLDLHVLPEAANTAGVRFALDYPASAVAINQVLGACEVPLDNEYDAMPRLSDAVIWVRTPQPQMPSMALERHVTHGQVGVACVVHADGRPAPCWIESETPRGVGFGGAALKAARDSRVSVQGALTGDAATVFWFTVSFNAS